MPKKYKLKNTPEALKLRHRDFGKADSRWKDVRICTGCNQRVPEQMKVCCRNIVWKKSRMFSVPVAIRTDRVSTKPFNISIVSLGAGASGRSSNITCGSIR
jgi:hypothetical protein